MQLHQAIFRQYLWKKIGSELIWFNERGERNQTKVNSEQNFQAWLCLVFKVGSIVECTLHMTGHVHYKYVTTQLKNRPGYEARKRSVAFVPVT